MRHSRFMTGILAAALIAGSAAGAASAETMSYMVKDGAIAQSLTGKPGDALSGIKAAVNRRQGNCLACHKLPIPDQQFHGNVGPDLAGVGDRLNAGEMRLRLVDPKKINPDTSMPAFYRATGLHRVEKRWQGKTVLTAQQIEDVIAYLRTLREDTPFARAFELARKANFKRFEWNGKVYTTDVK